MRPTAPPLLALAAWLRTYNGHAAAGRQVRLFGEDPYPKVPDGRTGG